MSIEIMSKSWKKSRQSGSRLLALLALADRADEDGVCWPGREWIARQARVQPGKNIRRILRALEDAGEIVYDPGRGRGRRTYYLVAIALEPPQIKEIAMRRFQMSEEEATAFLSDIVSRQLQQQLNAASTETLNPPSQKKGATEPPFPKKEGQPAPFSKKEAEKPPFSREKRADAPPFQKKKGGRSAPEKGAIQSPKRGPYGPPDPSLDPSIDPSEKDIQQQQGYEIQDRTRTREAPAVADESALQNAFRLAGIKSPTAHRLPDAWKQAAGRELTPEDVLAWHFQRLAENQGRPPQRQLGVGGVIRYLEAGEPADEAFYDQARVFLLDKTAPPEDAAILKLQQALQSLHPASARAELDALDAARARLPAIARDLAERGVDAETVSDLRLYLTYADRPLPPPQNLADALQEVGPEFRAWRQRREKAQQLWRKILTGLTLWPPPPFAQNAEAVDLNGALIILATDGFDRYFNRIWRHRGPQILAEIDAPERPIHFITRHPD